MFEYEFGYETKRGSEVIVTAEISLDTVGGCQGCGVKPCYHCSGGHTIDCVEFSIGGHTIDRKRHSRQHKVLTAYFDANEAERALEKAIDDMAEC